MARVARLTGAALDVAVVGGGPAGCATAIALRRRGVERVGLFEAGDYSGERIGESIPPDTRVVLERLGLMARFAADGHEPCLGSCSAWGSNELGYNDFVFNPHGQGWHLDRRRFDESLAAEAEAAGVAVTKGRRCDDARDLDARFVVDATGRTAQVARAMGARRVLHDRLTCVVGFVQRRPESRLTRLTMLEAVEYGWWYAARLPDERVAVAVAAEPDAVKSCGLHTREGWLAALDATEHLALELGERAHDAGELITRTAPSFVLDRVAGDGWLAVGDAASASDPICARGIHDALSGGLMAADALAAALDGDTGALDSYADELTARFSRYLHERDHLYGLEQRWPDAPFWAQRLRSTRRVTPSIVPMP